MVPLILGNPHLMDMDSILGTILGTILNYEEVPMSTLNGPLVKQILTVAHINTSVTLLEQVNDE